MNYFRFIDRFLWSLLILIASVYIVLAVCMSLGRFYMPQLEKLSPQLIAYLENRTGLEWQLEGLSGEWEKFRPVFRVNALVASLPPSIDSTVTEESLDDTDNKEKNPKEKTKTVFSLVDGELRLDLIASVIDLGVRITHVSAKQLSLSLDKTSTNQWTLLGLDLSGERRALSIEGFVRRLKSIDAQEINIDLPNDQWVTGSRWIDERIQMPIMQMHFQQFEQTRQFTFTQQAEAEGDGSLTIYASAIGDPFSADAKIDVYAVADQLSLTPWLVSGRPDTASGGISATKATNKDQWLVDDWSGQFWAVKHPNGNWQASVEVNSGTIQRNDNPDWRLSDISLRLSAEANGQRGIDLWWQQLGATWHDEPLNMPLANISIEREEATVSNIVLSMPTVDVGQLTEIVSGSPLLNEKLSEILQSLNVDGSVNQLHLAIPYNQAVADFKLEALLDNVSINAWKNIPGVSGVTGYINASSTSGSLELVNDSHFSLHLPKVYHDALLFDYIESRLNWSILNKRLLINADDMRFTMSGDEGRFGARFSIDAQTQIEDEPSQMALYIGVSDSHSSQLLKLLPYKINSNVQNWIAQSDLDANIIDGGFVYHGSLAKKDKHKRSIQLYLNLADADFNFHSQWAPVSNVDGLLTLAGNDVQMAVYSAEFEQLVMSDANVLVRGAGDDAAVEIDSRLAGDLGDVLAILQTSPLKARLENTLGDWQASGDLHDAKIRLYVPLKKGNIDKTQVDFTAAISGSELNMANIGLELSELNGPIAYSSTKGLVSKQLNGRLWEKPISLVLGDYQDSPQLQNGNSVRVDGQFDVETNRLYHWLKQPALAMAAGTAAIALRVDHSIEQTVLTANSDLVGVEFNLPALLYKSTEASADLALHWQMSAANQPMTLSIANHAYMQFNFDRYKMQGGSIVIGQDASPSDVTEYVATTEPKLFISGHLPTFNLTEWLTVYDRYEEAATDLNLSTKNSSDNSLSAESLPSNKSPSKKSPSKIVVKDLRLDKILAFGEIFTQGVVGAADINQRWQFDIDSDQLKGRIALPIVGSISEPTDIEEQSSSLKGLPLILSGVPEAQRYVIDLSYFRMAKKDPLESSATAADSALLLPENLVAAKINVQQLYWGDQDIGQWQFLLSPSSNAVLVHDLQVNYASMLFSTETDNGLLWAKNKSGEFASSLSLIGKSDSIEEFIRHFGNDDKAQSPIRSKHADVTIDLSWQGGPDAFSLNNADGSIGFKFKDGQFLKTSDSAAGLLKLIGIINFDTLVRRMKLDFSDLYKEGLSFDKVSGRLNISDSMARFYEAPITVKAPSSQFSLSGEVDLSASTIDAKLIATLPVASNLPWVAVLTGGLPVAAGVYIASKVFEDELDRLSSAVYIIDGSLADPEVKFERLFDNKNDKKAENKAESKANQADTSE
ncbi:DUF3971 domain-containing protein [Pseudomonadales bacterium]|nr:DUF3971 domain-containing protein [Pseudomonadales bacterium]